MSAVSTGNAFVYGTLIAPEVGSRPFFLFLLTLFLRWSLAAHQTCIRPFFTQILKLVMGRVPQMQAATLKGYRRYRLVDRAYPGILEDPAGSVEGMLLTGVTQPELDLLDGECFLFLRLVRLLLACLLALNLRIYFENLSIGQRRV